MDRQERHREKKEHEHDVQKKDEKAYEEAHEAQRAPYNSVVMLVVGTLLVLTVIWVWTTMW